MKDYKIIREDSFRVQRKYQEEIATPRSALFKKPLYNLEYSEILEKFKNVKLFKEFELNWDQLFNNKLCGKKIGNTLYVYYDSLRHISVQWDSLVKKLRRGCFSSFNVVRFNKSKKEISLLKYESFYKEDHPALLFNFNFVLKNNEWCFSSSRRFFERENPPILHRKELFVPYFHEKYEEWVNITKKEEELGLYENTNIIGLKKSWEDLCKEKENIMKSENLRKAKKMKNDEFYTKLADIENELKYYKKYFKNKVVFCNCDDPQESNFWKYFSMNFEHLGIKKLISTHYDKDIPTYKLEIVKDENNDRKIDNLDTIKTPLKQNGDFRSPESLEILKECDIVVTNPPFSLFREYVALLMEYNKEFLIIGSDNAITYKEIFPLLKNNKIWLGNKRVKEFIQADGTTKKFGNIGWFTNLKHKKRYDKLLLYKSYIENKEDYPIYDNFNAIEVSKVKDIPIDYEGIMGVPITFLDKYNPEQFEILGLDRYIKGNLTPNKRFCINNKEKYARIVIRKLK